jgi:hypothetical protein
LWCEVDGVGNVVRRMVVKEVRPSGFKWRDLTFWREGLPREIRVHQKVNSSLSSSISGARRGKVREFTKVDRASADVQIKAARPPLCGVFALFASC